MIFGMYQFFCSLEEEAVLPPYKGSTFRGVFGRSLKKTVCALKQQECPECLLREKCLYALTFETADVLEPPENGRMASIPHPFVIQPPLTTETRFPAGSSFDFNLLLFGEINHQLPYFIYAFDQMGKIGIGRKIKSKRGKFRLDKVASGKKTLYTADSGKLVSDTDPDELRVTPAPQHGSKTQRVRVRLETPLRLKFENRLQAALPFHILARAMLRRISSLMNAYGNGEPPLDYSRLVNRAKSVRIAESTLAWFDWRRYSFRQDKDMLMGGMVGSVTYEGNLDEYLPLLEFCEKVHLGKQTAFGLGKIQTELIS